MIAPIEIADGIRIYSNKDIIAMKVKAIFGRGSKKDFWDIYELLQHYTIDQFIECYNFKFPEQRLMISVPQALTYYEDAEESKDPVSLKGQNWESIKLFISKKVSDFLL